MAMKVDFFEQLLSDGPGSLLSMYNLCDGALVWIKDSIGRYRWANQPFARNFSFSSPREVVGRTDEAFAPAYLADLYRLDDARVLAGKPVIGRIEPICGFEALPRWFQTWKLPVTEPAGDVVGTIGMARPVPTDDSPEFPVPDLVPALRCMQDYLRLDCSNEQLARSCGMSVRAFERKFKAHFQMTPTQFLNRLRATRAAEHLCRTDTALVDLAAMFGFSDQSHMTREFKRHFGATPGAYRQEHREALA